MIAHHIHDALAQVKTVRTLLLERTLFQGYSGMARIHSGCLALCAALVLGFSSLPRTPAVHLTGWALVLAAALVMNYGALLYTFFFDARFKRDPARLKPAVDVLPPLAAGAALSLALLKSGQYNLLFGTWMVFFGLAHWACRRSMPLGNTWVGLFYLASGALCLLLPGIVFTSPWPMALVFFPGEVAGGWGMISARASLIPSQEGVAG